MRDFDYELGRIKGILEGFSYVNNKTNHGFTFRIDILGSEHSLEESSNEFLKNMYSDAQVSFEPIKSWVPTLSSYFEKWLFCYQPHKDGKGNTMAGGCGSYYSYLKDIDSSFNLYHKTFRNEFISELCNSIESIINVVRAVEVRLNTKDWYEVDWNDIALEGKKGNLYIHLGVSD